MGGSAAIKASGNAAPHRRLHRDKSRRQRRTADARLRRAGTAAQAPIG